METKARYVWVGAVTLALLALLAFFVVWLARLNEGSKHEYDIFFKQSVDGLAKGSAVNFSGVPVGQVKVIELWERDPGFVHVRIAVDRDVAIRIGTTATILGSFTGISTIQLEGATKDAPLLSCKGDKAKTLCPEGVPVIPTKQGGLGALLNSAPLLLERLATLTERLTVLFSDKNQASIEGILANTQQLTGGLAAASPQIQRTFIELQGTLMQAQLALAQFQQVAASSNAMMNEDFRPMVGSLNQSIKSIDRAAKQLDLLMGDARPAAQRVTGKTLPEAEAAIRDLRATTKALRDATEKISEQGASGLLGGPKLPDYKP
ncbi:MlaD family protein [Novosphingobium sp.]|uniref:MlaD family protein n=1 Tax=Novosphingobium sp. TaxID=1874826 RepID=UPI00286C4891|nr:MlaD family protein [Novosphingobium sp.]